MTRSPWSEQASTILSIRGTGIWFGECFLRSLKVPQILDVSQVSVSGVIHFSIWCLNSIQTSSGGLPLGTALLSLYTACLALCTLTASSLKVHFDFVFTKYSRWQWPRVKFLWAF